LLARRTAFVVSAALILAATGIAALVVATLLLRSVGPGLRLGRVLAGTRLVSIGDAIELARMAKSRYVRVTGRITSDDEFPDDQDRPLVFRRTRLEIGRGQRSDAWTTVLDEREAVPFAIETRSSSIAVDEAALGDGLVVIPRESIGQVRDLPTDVAASISERLIAEDAARLTIEQLSAVEYATVCGVPVVGEHGPKMTAGLGRPLIVTTLDQSAAMRLLARGRRGRVAVGAVLLAVGLALMAGALAAFLIGF
jgi:hypothetical protein